MDNPYKKSYCALKRAHVLREWLYSLLPVESRKKLPEKSSDLFFVAIENLIWNRRSRITSESEAETKSTAQAGQNTKQPRKLAKKMNTNQIARALEGVKAKTIGVYAADRIPNVMVTSAAIGTNTDYHLSICFKTPSPSTSKKLQKFLLGARYTDPTYAIPVWSDGAGVHWGHTDFLVPNHLEVAILNGI